MNGSIVLVIIIAIGMGLDLYAKSVCQGALLSHIDKMKLAVGVFLCGIYQMIILLVGYEIAAWLHNINVAEKGESINCLICMVIFSAIGIKMLRKAWKNEVVVETRHDPKYLIKIFITLCLQMGIYTFLTGLGLGLMQLKSVYELTILALVGLVAVLAGLISGYHFGYRQKTKAYAIGGGLLLFAVISTGVLYL